MPSNAISGVGTQFKRGDGASSEAFVAIAEVNQITGPSMTREQIDVTSLDSTGGYREYIAGFRDGGTVELNMNFTRTGYETLKDDFEADANVNYQICLADTDTTVLSFAGLVTDLPMSIPTDDKITVDVTVKITGEVTLES